MEITEASKILATYLGYTYIPFAAHQGAFTVKPGWYETRPRSKFASHLVKSGWAPINDEILGRFICRNHNQLRFFNSYDTLFEVVDKLEKENLSQWMYSWPDHEDPEKLQYNFNGIRVNVSTGYIYVCIELQLDPPVYIGECKDETLPAKQQLFWALVNAVHKVNEIKNRKDEE